MTILNVAECNGLHRVWKSALPFVCILLASFESPAKGQPRIYASTDNVASLRPPDDGFAATCTVDGFAVPDGVISAGSQANGVFVSHDGESSWNSTRNGLSGSLKVSSRVIPKTRSSSGRIRATVNARQLKRFSREDFVQFADGTRARRL